MYNASGTFSINMAAVATDDRARAGEPAPGSRAHLIS